MTKQIAVNGINYKIETYYVPESIKPKISLIKEFLDNQDKIYLIPNKFQRRKSYFEFSETATIILSRIDTFIQSNIPIILGSRWLKSLPWATFGKTDKPCGIYFETLNKLFNYYEYDFLKGHYYEERFYFRESEATIKKLAKKTNNSIGRAYSCAICFLVDVIYNCGPDCYEIFDLFSNDLRDIPEFFPLDLWENQRTKLMGDYGKIFKEPFDFRLGQQTKNPINIHEITVRFREINTKLGEGEIKHPIKFPTFDFDYYDENAYCDDENYYLYPGYNEALLKHKQKYGKLL